MKTSTPNLKQLAFFQLLIGSCAAGAGFWLRGFQLGASIAIGAGLMLFNLIFLGWSWQRLMAKKSIAWTIVIIVIKYAVLLGSIYYLAQMDWFNPVGAGLGISTFMVAALVLAMLFHRNDAKFTETKAL